jgi:hypothetical protein
MISVSGFGNVPAKAGRGRAAARPTRVPLSLGDGGAAVALD